MQIKIQSDKPIGGLTLYKIIDIFKVSQCPNESLRASIPEFTSFKDGVVTLGEGGIFFATFDTED